MGYSSFGRFREKRSSAWPGTVMEGFINDQKVCHLFFNLSFSLLDKYLFCPRLLTCTAGSLNYGGVFLHDSLALSQTLLMHPQSSCLVSLPNSFSLCKKHHLVWLVSQTHKVFLERCLTCLCLQSQQVVEP